MQRDDVTPCQVTSFPVNRQHCVGVTQFPQIPQTTHNSPSVNVTYSQGGPLDLLSMEMKQLTAMDRLKIQVSKENNIRFRGGEVYMRSKMFEELQNPSPVNISFTNEKDSEFKRKLEVEALACPDRQFFWYDGKGGMYYFVDGEWRRQELLYYVDGEWKQKSHN